MSTYTTKLDELVTHVPAIGNTEIHPDCSERYSLINSRKVAERMLSDGWELVGGRQSRSRIPGNRQYARHSMLFSRRDLVIPELNAMAYAQFFNAHAGRGASSSRLGFFRFACANEVMSGAVVDVKASVRHTGAAEDVVIDSIARLTAKIPALVENVREWAKYKVNGAEVQSLATAGLHARFGEDSTKWPVDPNSVAGHTRRSEDAENTLWLALNRVQENILRPFQPGKVDEESGKRIAFRRVSAFNRLADVNIALWNEANRIVGLLA